MVVLTFTVAHRTVGCEWEKRRGRRRLLKRKRGRRKGRKDREGDDRPSKRWIR